VAGGTTAADTKKAVCKAFASVVKGSSLPIDPKSFFMTLTTNYGMLVRDRRLDLGPLWDSMVASHPPDQLNGVFLMFRQKAMDLGLKVLLPNAVDRLSADQMREALEPWTGMMLTEEPTPYAGGVVVTPDLRRKIVSIVSSAIRSSPLGARFDAAKLTFQIDSAFEALFDGQRFDFAQIIAALRDSQALDDREVYKAVLRAKADLAVAGIDLAEPRVSLTPQQKQQIVDELRRADEQRAVGSSNPKVPALVPIPASTTPNPTKQKSSDITLEKYGLTSVREQTAKRRFPIRAIAMGLVLVASGVVAFLNRPSRPLAHEKYQAIMPIVSAELIDGTFQCVIDESRWFKLKVEQREERIAKFEAMLKSESLIDDMQCRDRSKRLVIAGVQGNRMTVSPAFLRGNENGVILKGAAIADKKP
jgi:hypothetical protein